MRIIVIGGDGYCGWPSALHLAARGHEVTIADNFTRRRWDQRLGVRSLTPIRTLARRLAAWEKIGEGRIAFARCNVTDYAAVKALFARVAPDAIVHFGQQRSAPFSMIDRDHAAETMLNNTLGNLNVLWAVREAAPQAHIVKLGTMGEYGTPDIEIEEGFITIEHKGRRDRLPFPKQPGSFYHLTKVSDSDQLYFAARTWGIRATDLNQGVVYGLTTDETSRHPDLVNRFDYDGIYGTVLNRFCVSAALERPLSVYGKGGQTRSFIDIRDTVRCIELAVGCPAEPGEFRVFNQFTEIFSVLELARRVQRVAKRMGLAAKIEHLENPRVERELHYYSSINERLRGLGLDPHFLTDETLEELIALARTRREAIDEAAMAPTVRWRDRRTETPQMPPVERAM